MTLQTTDDLYYESVGNGPDVLLLHGWASSAYMWAHVMAALQARLRLWAVDLPGFGATPLPADGPYDIDQHTATVLAFLDRHALRPHAIIGHSMGGLLALKLALARPHVADKLVPVCPVVTGQIGPSHLRPFLTSDTGRFVLSWTRPLWHLAQVTPLATLVTRPWHVSEAAARQVVADFRRANWQASVRALESMAGQNIEPELARIQQETLVIVGKHDTTLPPSEGHTAARGIPGATLVEFDRSHHQPSDEQPARFVATVRAFLCGTSGGL